MKLNQWRGQSTAQSVWHAPSRRYSPKPAGQYLNVVKCFDNADGGQMNGPTAKVLSIKMFSLFRAHETNHMNKMEMLLYLCHHIVII